MARKHRSHRKRFKQRLRNWLWYFNNSSEFHSRWYVAVAGIIAVLMMAFVSTPKARAHDPHTHLANEFSKARSKAKSLCCDGNDYTYVSPYSWERTDKGFRVYVHKRWIEVPADAEVANMKNPDGEAKVWLYFGDDGLPQARCFMTGIES